MDHNFAVFFAIFGHPRISLGEIATQNFTLKFVVCPRAPNEIHGTPSAPLMKFVVPPGAPNEIRGTPLAPLMKIVVPPWRPYEKPCYVHEFQGKILWT